MAEIDTLGDESVEALVEHSVLRAVQICSMVQVEENLDEFALGRCSLKYTADHHMD